MLLLEWVGICVGDGVCACRGGVQVGVFKLVFARRML
jgi:hypothetical protein